MSGGSSLNETDFSKETDFSEITNVNLVSACSVLGESELFVIGHDALMLPKPMIDHMDSRYMKMNHSESVAECIIYY